VYVVLKTSFNIIQQLGLMVMVYFLCHLCRKNLEEYVERTQMPTLPVKANWGINPKRKNW